MRQHHFKAMNPQELYEAIGEYVVAFQWLETVLWQTATFAKDPSQSTAGRWALLDLSFAELVRSADQAVATFVTQWAPADGDAFAESFRRILEECHTVRRERNRFVHSAYVHLEGGGQLMGVMRSHITWRAANGNGEPAFDQEIVTPDVFRAARQNVIRVGIAVKECHLQLIHWYRPEQG